MCEKFKQRTFHMKNTVISVAAVIALSSFGFAGGDIEPVGSVDVASGAPAQMASAGNVYV